MVLRSSQSDDSLTWVNTTEEVEFKHLVNSKISKQIRSTVLQQTSSIISLVNHWNLMSDIALAYVFLT